MPEVNVKKIQRFAHVLVDYEYIFKKAALGGEPFLGRQIRKLDFEIMIMAAPIGRKSMALLERTIKPARVAHPL